MAENTVINPGAGGDIIRTEDVGGGVKIQVEKIHTGGDDTDGGAVTVDNPFPVRDISTLIDVAFDYIALGYTGSLLTSVIYKQGGAGGTTVATLALAYSGSLLTSVTRT